jgi:hypothetical protein
MKIKINAVEGISLKDQCQIIKDYIGDNLTPKQTPKRTGTKIESCGRRYHVSCHKTTTMWVFEIWWGM